MRKKFIVDKLSALLEDKKASKLTEKIFTIYDDTKASQKNKKRSHPEDKDKDKDAKKSRFKDDETKNEKSVETQLSADKVLEFYIYYLSILNAVLYISIFSLSLDKANDG